MPSRTVHNDFARIFGIDLSIANRVNHEMDRPARYLGPSHRKVNHDAVFVAKMAQKYGLQGAQAAALHILLALGSILVNEDIKDFLPIGADIPFVPMVGGKGHIRGTIQHGAVGLALQSIAYLAGMAEVASQAAKSYEIEEELHEIAAEFEQLAYPSKT